MNKQNRRTFLKTMVTIPAGLSLNSIVAGSSALGTGHDNIPTYSNLSALSWRKTIFCQFDHPTLKLAIDGCAQEIQCVVCDGEPYSPDIYAISGFVQVLDRNTIGRDVWNEYVEFADEVFDDVPCIIIDSMNNLKLPRSKCITRFNLDNADSVSSIISTIKEIRVQMDQHLPKHLVIDRVI